MGLSTGFDSTLDFGASFAGDLFGGLVGGLVTDLTGNPALGVASVAAASAAYDAVMGLGFGNYDASNPSYSGNPAGDISNEGGGW